MARIAAITAMIRIDFASCERGRFIVSSFCEEFVLPSLSTRASTLSFYDGPTVNVPSEFDTYGFSLTSLLDSGLPVFWRQFHCILRWSDS